MSVQVLPRGHEGGRGRRGLNSVVGLSLVFLSSAALWLWFVRYTRPEPGRFQQALFLALLALIAMELWQARLHRRPLAGARRVRMANAAGPPRASALLGVLVFACGFGGFLAFLWGTVGGLLVTGEANFVWIACGTLGMLLGAVFALQGRGGGRGAL